MMRDMRRGLVCRWWGLEALVDWVQWACRAYGAGVLNAMGTQCLRTGLMSGGSPALPYRSGNERGTGAERD
jgi:hypothetical protein